MPAPVSISSGSLHEHPVSTFDDVPAGSGRGSRS